MATEEFQLQHLDVVVCRPSEIAAAAISVHSELADQLAEFHHRCADRNIQIQLLRLLIFPLLQAGNPGKLLMLYWEIGP